ncbi:hypothetical protein [Caenispirillum bisanense]|uniref:hypothetical protein n=1 Tax=Caenispirillum bisanense TaxID=414052 RepID=UPI0031D6B624
MHRNVTGRDGWIMARALYMAIRHAETLPEKQVPHSDIDDMRALLAVSFPGLGEVFQQHDSNPPDLTDGKAATIYQFPQK